MSLAAGLEREPAADTVPGFWRLQPREEVVTVSCCIVEPSVMQQALTQAPTGAVPQVGT